MLEAEKAGEISKVEDPEGGNGVYYSFRQIKIGVEKGHVTRRESTKRSRLTSSKPPSLVTSCLPWDGPSTARRRTTRK